MDTQQNQKLILSYIFQQCHPTRTGNVKQILFKRTEYLRHHLVLSSSAHFLKIYPLNLLIVCLLKISKTFIRLNFALSSFIFLLHHNSSDLSSVFRKIFLLPRDVVHTLPQDAISYLQMNLRKYALFVFERRLLVIFSKLTYSHYLTCHYQGGRILCKTFSDFFMKTNSPSPPNHHPHDPQKSKQNQLSHNNR